MQNDLTLVMTKATWDVVIQPLEGQWHDGRLVISGPPFARAWASHRFAPFIRQAAQAEVVFAES